MKRLIAIAALLAATCAQAAGELVATGADVRTWTLGEAGGVALSGQSVGVPRTLCPYRVYVTNAVKRTQSTQSVFTPTNYIVTATVTATNAVPKWSDFTKNVTNLVFITDAASTNLATSAVTNVHSVAGVKYGSTNVITSVTLTNAVTSIGGIAAPWECIATNGVTSTVTNYTTTAAGGTVTLSNSYGDTWSVSLSGGAGSTTNTPNLSKLVFPGDLRLTATQAERLDLKIVYLTFIK